MIMEDFIELVRLMRTTQKKYFSTRGLDALKLSKTLKSQVDQAIRELQGLPL